MSDPLSTQLAEAITHMLDATGTTQADLARTMGLSAKHINQMVQGKSGALGMYDYAAFTLGCKWVVTLEPKEANDG